MLNLRLSELSDPGWEAAGVGLPAFPVEEMRRKTLANPKWVHFGAGNIFRAFPCAVLQQMLEQRTEDIGLIVAEGFDEEIVERIYKPHDNLCLLATLKDDGTVEKKVIASVAQALTMKRDEDLSRLSDIFRKESLKMVSFTITEKGYQCRDGSGAYFPWAEEDFSAGPTRCASYLAKVTALCYVRFLAGKLPLALVSMDNFSHNGDKLKEAILMFALQWEKRGLTEGGFSAYLRSDRVSFPWTMIDKITPRPDPEVEQMLKACGVGGMEPVVTEKHTYIAPFVNAEECQYLVVEDEFPAGRPALEKGGLIFTSRETVDKTEKMKVCTCLNPLHTALAIFGCLLGYDRIHEEMKDPLLRKLVEQIGYREGLPAVVDPQIIRPRSFIDEVIRSRIPNPFMPDTPQRIATDTSQKLSIRFGETIKTYLRQGWDIEKLKGIPLVFAGWCRYLLGMDDNGREFVVSPDPMYEELRAQLSTVRLGDRGPFSEVLDPILRNSRIFGVDLYEAGLGQITEKYFAEMTEGRGAVRETLRKYVEL